MTKSAVSLKDRRKLEEGDTSVPLNNARLKALKSEQLSSQFSGKKFSDLSSKEKDKLLQTIAVTLGLISE